ncbi:nucleotide sugar dehydrogenase [Nocardioides rotundus]|uniref:nucleotide sugar dehydrogenase n=1 Tax=Nocardioides rotundus TaxID=1774216 RepID=UPI001CBEEACE|nr:nucleotide sugar dehydrogenase [Nocardioides rotundus]UAL30098.1 nucleotide sugar dehydrogenase [Nocardioides rotundus]
MSTRIAVAGLGYVGLSVAAVLARSCTVVGLDVDAERVAELRSGGTPIQDADLARFLAEEDLDLTFTTDPESAYADAEFVVIATPTDYDTATDSFDTRSVEAVMADVRRLAPEATMVIKSTVPVGYVDSLDADDVFFSPEFLREGRALHDNLHPSRIVVGEDSDRARWFAQLLVKGADTDTVPVLVTGSTEAEAIKLFANTYLAMRVAFFNELDSYALLHGLDSREVIDGVGLDARIGGHYNNPSFGYGGYCLPKDTRQLLANYAGVPQNLIRAVVEANTTRMDVVAADVLSRRPRVVGVHRLTMKAGSDNFRSSAVIGVMERLSDAGVDLLVYEPGLAGKEFLGATVCRDLGDFSERAEVILANRMVPELAPVADKVWTRDLFGAD